MADKKITQLPASTVPLAGTEVLPIVQSGTTKQVSVNNLTAGKAVSALSLTLTGSALPIASGGTNQTAFTSPASSIAGLVWFDGTSFQNDATTSHVGYNASTNVFYANTPTFSGDATLSTGNLVIGTSGKGIDFSATAGTGTSELFSDYEEGTWTPAYTGSTTDPTVTYTNRTGRYTKIGRIVNVCGFIQATPTVAGVGVLQISGLPYTSANVTECVGSVGYCSQFTATGSPVSIVVGQNATVMNLYKTASADARSGTYTNVSAATDLNLGGGYFYFSATYMV